MKEKIILRSKNGYDRGTYKAEGGGHWNGLTIWDFQFDAVAKDMKAEGYTVYKNEWITPQGTLGRKEVLVKI